MAGIFKKALSVFVEFDENETPTNTTEVKKTTITAGSVNSNSTKPVLNNEDIEKFEKHFETLMNDANLPGPDYFEFCKMMEALEAHVPDEKARYAAVFATLTVQGLNKNNLINSAAKYKQVIQEDRSKFELAVNEKLKSDVENRKNQIKDLEIKITQNSEKIKQLTQEIVESQGKLQNLNNEIISNESKIKANSEGYTVASDAMLNKINQDIQKIESLL